MREELEALKAENAELYALLAKEGGWPAGHYYSPIPDKAGVLRQIGVRRERPDPLLEIDLNGEGHAAILEDYASYQAEIPFPEQKEEGFRYFHENDWFSYADAVFLYCFLRRQRPKRIIEVGSGFSSALMLDTIGLLPGWEPQVTLIEPYPERLKSLLEEEDPARISIVESKVQELSPELFGGLAAGDLLFIDSSHVIKCGGDLQFLMFEVMPRLPQGVFVQFHDIFHPFEYPEGWLRQERNWNEIYLLRAFLAYNRSWEIHFFNSYVAAEFPDLLAERFPLCTRTPGASIYLRKTGS